MMALLTELHAWYVLGAALSATMKTIRTWLAFRREGRGYSLIEVARGWQ